MPLQTPVGTIRNQRTPGSPKHWTDEDIGVLGQLGGGPEKEPTVDSIREEYIGRSVIYWGSGEVLVLLCEIDRLGTLAGNMKRHMDEHH